MRGFDRNEFIEVVGKTASLTEEISELAEKLYKDGFSNLFLIGAGGTYCQFEPYEYMLRGITSIPVYCEIAAEFMARPHQAFNEKSLVVVASRSGDTKEIVQLEKFIKERGNNKIVAILQEKNTPIGELADYTVDIGNRTTHCVEPMHMMFCLFFYKLAALNGDFLDYDEFAAAFASFPEDFIKLKEQFDPIALEFAKKHKDTDFHMFIGSGSVYGEMYGLAMCIFEEMQWIKTQSVKAAEFFHGALEIVEKDTSVIIIRPEDWSRAQADRAIRFCKEYTDNLLAVDLSEYKLPGLPDKFRPYVGMLITTVIMERMGANIAVERDHSLDIRRYYRQFDY